MSFTGTRGSGGFWSDGFLKGFSIFGRVAIDASFVLLDDHGLVEVDVSIAKFWRGFSEASDFWNRGFG